MNTKQKIEKNFDAASTSYEQVATVQKLCAQHLVNMLKAHFKTLNPSSIFDVGAGTGYVAWLLQYYFPAAEYTLNDVSNGMLNIAKRKFSGKENFSFLPGDIEKNYFGKHELIVSNLSLQWADDLAYILKKLYAQSKNLAFSLLLWGTFDEWNARLNSFGLTDLIKVYPHQQWLQDLLQTLKPLALHIEVKEFSLNFDNPLNVMRYLQQLGANTPAAYVNLPQLLRLVKTNKEPCKLNYKVMFVLLEK
jgi:malonyl-CoA O-methyltransferase